MKKTNPETRESFIKILALMSPQEINKMIEEKGVEVKPLPLIVKY